MTRFPSTTSLLALTFAAGSVAVPATVAAQSVQDFQLPPNPSPTPTPTVQGPVDVENGVPAVPRPIVTPVPTPAARPTPTATPSPVRSPVPSPAPTPRPRATPTATLPSNREAPAAPPSLPTPGAGATASPEPAPTGSQIVPGEAATPSFNIPPAPTVPAPETASENASTEGEGTPASWWLLGLAALAALAAAAVWWRRRSPAPLRIEPPVVRKDGGPALAAPRAALTLRPEAIRLSRSVMAATLTYRLTVLNRGTEALTDVVIEADLGSASGDRPVEEQVAMATTAREPRHTMPRLAPGQSARFEGKLQLQLSEAGILRQGNTPLLVPLLRLRTTAQGIEPQAQTLAIGQQGTGGSTRLQPFRLDEGPRGYEPLAQRMLG
jgi:hypothetical protein